MNTMFLPVSGSYTNYGALAPTVDIRQSLSLLEKIEAKQVSVPSTLNDLVAENTFTSTLSLDVAAKLGIPFASVGGNFTRKVFIQEYSKYSEIPDPAGNGKIRYGVAVRWICTVKVISANVSLASLPALSASAQLGYAEASCQFQVLGATAAEITKLVPSDTELNVETYIRLKDALAKIKEKFWDPATLISPQVLAVYGSVSAPSDTSYQKSLAVSWALQKIKDGEQLGECLADAKTVFGSEPVEEIIKSVYQDVSGSTDVTVAPDQRAKIRAGNLLGNLRIRS